MKNPFDPSMKSVRYNPGAQQFNPSAQVEPGLVHNYDPNPRPLNEQTSKGYTQPQVSDSNLNEAGVNLNEATRNLARGTYITLSTLIISLSLNAYTAVRNFFPKPQNGIVRIGTLSVPEFSGGDVKVETIEVDGRERYHLVHRSGAINGIFHIKGYGTETSGNGKDTSFLIGDSYKTNPLEKNCEFHLEKGEIVPRSTKSEME